MATKRLAAHTVLAARHPRRDRRSCAPASTSSQPDLAIDPQGVVKSAARDPLDRAPRRVGLARPWRRERLAGLAYTDTVPGSASRRHVVASNLELVRVGRRSAAGRLRRPDGRWLLRSASATAAGLARTAYLGAAAAGRRPAGQGSCRWRGLAEVAVALAAGRLAGQVVAGGPASADRAEAVVERGRRRMSAWPRPPTSTSSLPLLAGARVVIGGDTGPVHLAASLGVPTVAVFTATDWRRNGPLGALGRSVTGAPGSRTCDDARTSRPRRAASPSRQVTARGPDASTLACELLGVTPALICT